MIKIARTRRALVRNAEGFTLIELLIVVVIIAILLSVAIGAQLAIRQRAANEAAKSLVFQAVPSLETYYADHGGYAGVTMAGLKAGYDQALDTTRISLANVTADSYCVQATYSGEIWRKNGPGQLPEKLPCP
jgi:prepilin-type N-terminal cleavage/methylation domain-containing protein